MKKILRGTVVSNKMNKSIVVKVDREVIHPKYKVKYKKSKKFMAHDEKNTCQIGDIVEIIECRPLSRRKRWRLLKIIKKAETTPNQKNQENIEKSIPDAASKSISEGEAANPNL